MKSKLFVYVNLLLIIQLLAAPLSTSGETNNVELTLSFTNLADPGEDHYEGWLIVDGNAVSTGKFTLDTAGKIVDLEGKSVTSFSVENIDLDKTTKFVLTLELKGDTDPSPHSIKPLAGDLDTDKTSASLSQNTGADFSNVAGKYILATPTDGADTNENSGIWFLDLSSGMPAAGLTLPDLTGTDWTYEGWVVINNVPVTTGTFDKIDDFDNFDGFSSNQGGPPFPGEDFLGNATNGLTFPTDIAGMKAVISIEPRMDNSEAPFQFKPLIGDIPADAKDHVTYSMEDKTSGFATGMVSISVDSTSDDAPGFGFIAILSFLSLSVLITRKRLSN